MKGEWKKKVLYSFCPTETCTDGAVPDAGVIMDNAGNLYGTTSEGGAYGGAYGTVFQLTPGANGTWTETVLYSFSGADGYSPSAGLIMDVSGNLYGTTVAGGASGTGCRENELSLQHGWRLLSAYTMSNGTKFWIITEADRSLTTFLLPDEY